jgi:hypothetical protein
MPLPVIQALPAILAAASAIPQIGKIGMGLFQSRKAKKLSEKYNLEDRPRASMTEGFNQYLSQAERMAGSDLPGRDILEGDIRQSTSKGLTSARQLASTESSAMAGMLGLMEQERASMRRLGAQALQWQAQQQQNLSQAYLRKGQEEQRIWKTNEWMPWQMGMNQAESFRKAGRQNIFSGLEGLSAAAIQGAGMANQNQMYDKMIDAYLAGGQPPPPPAIGGMMSNVAQGQLGASGNLGNDPYAYLNE